MTDESAPDDMHGEINEWIAQTRVLAARLRVIKPPIAATMASIADEIEERLATVPEPPGPM